MKFKDEAHQRGYVELINRAKVKDSDVERKSLFIYWLCLRKQENTLTHYMISKKIELI